MSGDENQSCSTPSTCASSTRSRAEFHVGEHHRAMVHAVTGGEEKPLKYPVVFRSADLVPVDKIDLLPHPDVDMGLFHANLRAVNPGVTVLEVSARTGEGVDRWCDRLVDAAGPRGSPPAAGAAPA